MAKRQRCHGHFHIRIWLWHQPSRALHARTTYRRSAKYVHVITSRKDPMAPSFVLGVILWHYLPFRSLTLDNIVAYLGFHSQWIQLQSQQLHTVLFLVVLAISNDQTCTKDISVNRTSIKLNKSYCISFNFFWKSEN